MFDRMGDNDQSLPEMISDTLNTIEEFTGANVKHATASKAVAAYISQQAAAIGLTGLVALGGPATISQEPIRRPDENQAIQSRSTDALLEGSSLFEEVAVSGSPLSVRASDPITVSDDPMGEDDPSILGFEDGTIRVVMVEGTSQPPTLPPAPSR